MQIETVTRPHKCTPHQKESPGQQAECSRPDAPTDLSVERLLDRLDFDTRTAAQ